MSISTGSRAFLGSLALMAALACPASGAGEDATINFSFDQVDVANFVKLVGQLTDRKFVLGEGVQGKITVVSPRVSPKELYPLFLSVLESAGYSVEQVSGVYKVVAMPKRDTPAAPVVGADEPTPADGIITKILRLQNVSASDVRKALESKIGGGKAGAITAVDETNHLLITDTAESIRRIEKIVAEIDKPGTQRMTEVIPLQFASAEDLAQQLNVAMSESESRGEQLKNRLPDVPGSTGGAVRRGLSVVPSPHSNSLILVGTGAQIAELRRLITLMDVDSPAGRGRLNAIFLKYLAASEAATNLTSLLSRSTAQPGSNPSQRMKVAIEANAANNALLVDASPSDFDVVKKLVEQLDQLPQQVHVSVLILEKNATDNFEFGLEGVALDLPGSVGDTVGQGALMFTEGSDGIMNTIQNGFFPRGITVAAAHGTSVDADGNVKVGYPGVVNLKAIRQNQDYRVLSETALSVQNNIEASVNIVNQIPVLKSTVQGGSGTAKDVIQNIDRIDVGIKLKLVPHIIPGGEVQMKLNPSIEAVTDPGISGSYTPTISRREVSTTVTVMDGRTIVIAGLTRTDAKKLKERIPILGSIPILGLLFRHTVETTEKVNLIILVTPRVVPDTAAAEKVMQDWQNKTELKADEKP